MREVGVEFEKSELEGRQGEVGFIQGRPDCRRIEVEQSLGVDPRFRQSCRQVTSVDQSEAGLPDECPWAGVGDGRGSRLGHPDFLQAGQQVVGVVAGKAGPELHDH